MEIAIPIWLGLLTAFMIIHMSWMATLRKNDNLAVKNGDIQIQVNKGVNENIEHLHNRVSDLERRI